MHTQLRRSRSPRSHFSRARCRNSLFFGMLPFSERRDGERKWKSGKDYKSRERAGKCYQLYFLSSRGWSWKSLLTLSYGGLLNYFEKFSENRCFQRKSFRSNQTKRYWDSFESVRGIQTKLSEEFKVVDWVVFEQACSWRSGNWKDTQELTRLIDSARLSPVRWQR